jgi:phenylalanyl-tRNA synthetase beta chain
MKFSLSWLKDFVDITVPVDEACAMLTSLGIEVASVEKRHVPSGVLAAKILAVARHPNADKLSVCTVDAGQSAPLTIVCGAPNVAPGMVVPLAVIGTKFENGMTISRAKLRGVESFGMLCSEKELGLSDDHSGIIKLADSVAPGTALSALFPDDDIIEVEITPNRGDCLCVLGVARELAAKTKTPLRSTALSPEESGEGSIADYISVSIEAPGQCPRYCGRLVKGVTIAPSPSWMARRLSDAGIRPINNVVDITNYMLLHFGQPMHAFDYACIGKKKIVVKKAGDVKTYTTLDQVQRSLEADDLLIWDGERPAALAGIMGGAGTEISDTTSDVFLECAYFDPAGIRTTSKRLGLSTESSYRFERGVDPDSGLLWSIDTAAEMLRLYAGGRVVAGRIDEYPAPVKRPPVTLRTSRVKRLLGVDIPKPELISLLAGLQIACKDNDGEAIECTSPTFRHDIANEADLIEEAGRFFGYDNIPASEVGQVSLTTPPSASEARIDAIRSSLAFSGLNELVTNSLTSEKKNLLLMPAAAPVQIKNPLSPDMAQLRTSMLTSCLEVISYNGNRKNTDSRFFEIGRVYEAQGGGKLPRERDMVAIALAGNFFSKAWNNQEPAKNDFYLLKGILDKLAAAIGANGFTYAAPPPDASFFDGQASAIDSGPVRGAAGKVRDDICAQFDIKETVWYAELDITGLLCAPVAERTYRPLPKYPALERDFCFVVPETVFAAHIAGAISGCSPLVERVMPFDLYRGEKLGTGLKSMAFSVSMRSNERTLVDKEAEEICKTIIATMEKKFNAVLRT